MNSIRKTISIMNLSKKITQVLLVFFLIPLSFSQSMEIGESTVDIVIRELLAHQIAQSNSYEQLTGKLYQKAITELNEEGTNVFALFSNKDVGIAMIAQKEKEILIRADIPTFPKELLKLFAATVSQEGLEGNIDSVHVISSKGHRINRGFSFTKFAQVERNMLGDVSQRFCATGVRPLVLDMGAGFGITSWRILAAGGRVNCVDQTSEIGREIQQNIQKAKPFIGKSKLKDITRIIIGDALNFENPAYQASYDVTWSGNLLHFFTPTQAQEYVNHLYAVTKEAGAAYAIVQTPDNPDLINFILTEKDKGHDYPGFMIVNRCEQLPEGLDIRDGIIQATQRQMGGYFKPVSRASEKNNPQVSHIGPYPGNCDHCDDLIESPYDLSESCGEVIYGHMTMMYFDEDSLRQLYEKAGFTVKEVFYEHALMKVAHKLVPDMGRNGFQLSLIAVKEIHGK